VTAARASVIIGYRIHAQRATSMQMPPSQQVTRRKALHIQIGYCKHGPRDVRGGFTTWRKSAQRLSLDPLPELGQSGLRRKPLGQLARRQWR